MKKIMIFGGGTLGHIFPAISVINNLDNDKYDILFILTNKDQKYNIESKINKGRIKYIESYGINRKNLFKIFFKNIIAMIKIQQIMKEFEPMIVIGMGGYISGIGIFCANKQKIKTIIHEQNSILGLANKLVYKKVDLFLTTYPMQYKNSICIGNPRYYDAREYLLKNKILNNKKNIIFISGTLGSKTINDLAYQFINSEYSKQYQVTIITGKKYYDEINSNKQKNVFIIPFTNNMLDHLLKNNIVISRSGSTTLFEILGLQKVSILIPSPNVTNNHQEHNANYFKENNLGEVILEKDLNLEYFIKVLQKVENNYEYYKNNLSKIDLPNAIDVFIKKIEQLTGDMNE